MIFPQVDIARLMMEVSQKTGGWLFWYIYRRLEGRKRKAFALRTLRFLTQTSCLLKPIFASVVSCVILLINKWLLKLGRLLLRMLRCSSTRQLFFMAQAVLLSRRRASLVQ